MRYTYHITIQKPLRCDGQTLGTHRDTASCASVNEAQQFINRSLGIELVTRDMVSNYFLRPHLSNKKLFGQTVLLERTQHSKAKRTSSCPRGCSPPASGQSD